MSNPVFYLHAGVLPWPIFAVFLAEYARTYAFDAAA